VSNVPLSSSGDSIDNSNHELLTSQTGLTRQCLRYQITPKHSEGLAVSESQYQWARKSLSELVDFYYTEIRTAMQEANYDPKHSRPN